MGDRDVVLGEERDLVGLHVDAVGGEHVRAEQAALGEQADARLARPGRPSSGAARRP